jgi:type IV pilus assembly protein PilN
MPRINLLPWREEERRERKLKFLVALGGASIVGVVVAGALYLLMGSMVDAQNKRNDLLRAEIKQLDKQIEEINDLESAKQKFIARMEIIEKLQRSRPQIVHVFDDIVRTMPDGVYLTGVSQKDKKLKFEGVAQSSTRVSSFMRNIDSSEWLKNPELEVVESGKAAGGSSFTLYADEVSTDTADTQETQGKRGRKVVASRGTSP